MLQATSSPRNRRHNILGTHLVKKPVVSTGLHLIYREPDQTVWTALCRLRHGWMTAFIWFQTGPGAATLRDNSSGRLTGPPASRPSGQGCLPFCAIHLHIPPAAVWSASVDPSIHRLFQLRAAVVTTTTYQPTLQRVGLGESYTPSPVPKSTSPTLKPPDGIPL